MKAIAAVNRGTEREIREKKGERELVVCRDSHCGISPAPHLTERPIPPSQSRPSSHSHTWSLITAAVAHTHTQYPPPAPQFLLGAPRTNTDHANPHVSGQEFVSNRSAHTDHLRRSVLHLIPSSCCTVLRPGEAPKTVVARGGS